MLKHEQADPPTVSPTIPLPVPNAADARVTPGELNAALKTLEDQQANTVAIGSVVDELHLSATPEQIWAQVQKQRAEQSVLKPQMHAVPVMQNKKLVRRVVRGWHGMSWWIWVIFWCSGGLGLFAGLPHLMHHSAPVVAASGQRITISGDSVTEEVNAQGKDVVISGDSDKITLHGTARSLTVDGDGDTVIADTADTALIDGDGDTVKWTGTPPSDLSDPSHRERSPSKGTP